MSRCLITGASRGIGRAIATTLAAPGSTLLLHGRAAAALGETAAAAQAKGARVETIICDLATSDGVEQLTAAAGADPLDVLINNAGIAVVRPYDQITADEWDRTLAVNVTAPFQLIQRFAPAMQSGASIVNILSIAAKTAYPNWSGYCASKFAMEGLTSAIREELRPRGVRVINIYPAATATELWNYVPGEWPRDKMMSAVDVGNAVAFALAQPAAIAVDNITLSNTAGAL